MEMSIPIKLYQQRIHQVLLEQLPSIDLTPKTLHQAMHYAVFNGGKRLRPLLVYATGEALKVNLDQLDIPACAIEFIHTYSLIHDDLPAMDDDDWRRGKLSCHKAFDEATAILAGDALQTLAFESLSRSTDSPLSHQQQLQMIHLLACASGSAGMAGGQSLDLSATPIKSAEIEMTHRLKTGALINASLQLAIIAANINLADPIVVAILHYGHCVGLAFQIQDDILDVEGNLHTLGKIPGSDDRRGKMTYVSIMGLDQAKKKVTHLKDEALSTLASANIATDGLSAMTHWMVRE